MSKPWQPSAGEQRNAPSKPCAELRPFHGEIHALIEADKAFFRNRYQLERAAEFIFVDQQTNRYALPIYAPDHSRRGMVLRQPWDGAPLVARFHTVKADTFNEKPGPIQSHHWAADRHSAPWDEEGRYFGPLVMVEDQLSAIKLAEHGYDSVAFLGTPSDIVGTYGGMDRVREITQRMHVEGHREAVIALDADATDAAFMFARKWEYAFDKLRIAILEKDIKDSDYRDFSRILGA